MRDHGTFYIDGAWVASAEPRSIDVIDPATEQVAGRVAEAGAADVDRAVAAARRAFATWSVTTRAERLALLTRIVEEYRRREADIAAAITLEMGAPAALAAGGQTKSGLSHFEAAITVLADYVFEEQRGTTRIRKEAIGVCGLITPWNWPMNQVACKVAPALATGCTIVLKPSEVAPFSAVVFAEILDAAGVPPGVFNLINGAADTGAALASHRDVDMVSFTGSTRGGVAVAIAAAPTVKRVAQELGGKSPIILFPGADFPKAIAAGIRHVMNNSGQSCNAPTRMLIPAGRMDEAVALAREETAKVTIGSPASDAVIGPVVSQLQWQRIQQLIEKGIAEGATLVAGGPGKPDGLETGYYVRPTVFADVTSDMTIAREEIFGPVLSIIGYDDSDDAVRIANDTDYGLAAYLWGGDGDDLPGIAARIRAGRISINGSAGDILAPFGGYKMSGNGREWGEFGFDEFVELKAVLGG
ncbi:aldehyde dehydrogenase family protein [Sphingopyxis macrogoltabida]|uniref:Aldehyde dehydrogenase n=1 Tax=Sphingopyxis macrogoltabida TaxID=33050 RepID=A0AAC9AUR2_SPHMC|nr:aldehyde dehydrogenase family protein [Sphingopyxis macrogoltabida]ALJ13618.1 aldehyde dehydrogenase [Sphingopyxis macrogoltabida]AMU88937.1 aldehyde dehydrogenase [Sphingopyxis macrogoltabida]